MIKCAITKREAYDNDLELKEFIYIPPQSVLPPPLGFPAFPAVPAFPAFPAVPAVQAVPAFPAFPAFPAVPSFPKGPYPMYGMPYGYKFVYD